MGYIYLITNTVNGKRYVGQTIRNDIETRWKEHKIGRGVGEYLLKSYKKYGIDTFKFQIICICFDNDCNKYEIEYIEKYKTLYPNGYNFNTGGKNAACLQETRNKLSEKMKGKKASIETKLKLSELNKGKNNPQFGKKRNQDEINAIWTPEFREQRIKQTTGNNNPNFGKKSVHRKEIGMYNLENKLLDKFESIHIASVETEINERCISGTCNGRQKTAGGFVWKFL